MTTAVKPRLSNRKRYLLLGLILCLGLGFDVLTKDRRAYVEATVAKQPAQNDQVKPDPNPYADDPVRLAFDACLAESEAAWRGDPDNRVFSRCLHRHPEEVAAEAQMRAAQRKLRDAGILP